MTTSEGLTAAQVAERLGVELATVYAYASRGALTRHVAPAGRTSRYDPDEVELLARRARPRSSRRSATAVDVVIGTTVSEIGDGWVRYRNHDLADLVGAHPYESVAHLLFTGDLPAPGAVRRPERGPDRAPDRASVERVRTAVRRATLAVGATAPVTTRLAVAAAVAGPLLPDHDDRPSAAGLLLVDALVESLPVIGSGAGLEDPAVETVAARLWRRVSPLAPTPVRVRALDAALVVLAEHELATSTLAVRVAASTQAGPAEALLAGLGTVSGALHGRAAVAVHEQLLAGDDHVEAGRGHLVHRSGDPRFAMLIEPVLAMAPPARRARVATAFRRRRGEERPNVDAALGALAFVASAEPGITEAVFAIARTAGWLAHAYEEADEAPLRFRGRTLYRGPRDGAVSPPPGRPR